MKPICSVGTNAAKCVAKLRCMNAVMILIALHSKVYSLHLSFSDTCKVGPSVKDDGEANSCSVSHNPKLLGPQDFITFSTRKCVIVHLMLIYQPQRLLNLKQDVLLFKFKLLCNGQLSKKRSYIYIL